MMTATTSSFADRILASTLVDPDLSLTMNARFLADIERIHITAGVSSIRVGHLSMRSYRHDTMVQTMHMQ
jgi:hypothetical protein